MRDSLILLFFHYLISKVKNHHNTDLKAINEASKQLHFFLSLQTITIKCMQFSIFHNFDFTISFYYTCCLESLKIEEQWSVLAREVELGAQAQPEDAAVDVEPLLIVLPLTRFSSSMNLIVLYYFYCKLVTKKAVMFDF